MRLARRYIYMQKNDVRILLCSLLQHGSIRMARASGIAVENNNCRRALYEIINRFAVVAGNLHHGFSPFVRELFYYDSGIYSTRQCYVYVG